jgi:hypothetical protein
VHDNIPPVVIVDHINVALHLSKRIGYLYLSSKDASRYDAALACIFAAAELINLEFPDLDVRKRIFFKLVDTARTLFLSDINPENVDHNPPTTQR